MLVSTYARNPEISVVALGQEVIISVKEDRGEGDSFTMAMSRQEAIALRNALIKGLREDCQ